MEGGKREINPLVLKLCFALALPIAGYLVFQFRSKPRLPPPKSKSESKSKSSSDDDGSKESSAKSSAMAACDFKDELHLLTNVGSLNPASDWQTKRRKVIAGGARPDSVRICTTCDVVCNSDKVFAFHLAGEKHAFKAFGIPTNPLKPKVPACSKALHPTDKATHPTPRTVPETAARQASNGLVTYIQSSYCDLCKVYCTTQEVLSKHKLGRKHIKNLQELQGSIKPEPPNTSTKVVTRTADPIANHSKAVTLIANPSANRSKAVNKQAKQNAGPATKEDLKTKKRRVLRGGAAPDAVRVCTHCNVVCNSGSAYNSHIAGKKHAAVMSKH